MKKLLILLALLSAAGARAQTACRPQLQAFHENQQIKTAGSALPPSVTLALTSDPACPSATTYQIKKAEMTLIRGRRALMPARSIQGTEADLSDFAKLAQPGDRLYVEVLELVSTPAGGQPTTARPPDDNRIALNWVLMQ